MCISIVLISCASRTEDNKEDNKNGVFVRPDTFDSIVIMLHGFQSHYDEVGNLFKDTANELLEKNIASYRFNFSGEGERNKYYVTSTMESRLQESVEAYNKVKKEYPTKKIGVIGFSLGGLTASYVITTLKVDVTVLWSPTYDGSFRLISKNYDDNVNLRSLSNNDFYDEVTWSEQRISRQFIYGLIGWNSYSVIDTYDGDLLVIRGTNDFLQYDDSDFLSHASKAKSTSFIQMEDADHIFNVLTDDKTHSQTLIENTVSYFVEKF